MYNVAVQLMEKEVKQVHSLLPINRKAVVHRGGSTGAHPQRATVLSFSHTKFLKSGHVGAQHHPAQLCGVCTPTPGNPGPVTASVYTWEALVEILVRITLGTDFNCFS